MTSKIQVGLIFVSVSFLMHGMPARAGDEILPATQVIPRETAILLLPPLDATSDAKNMQAPRQLVIRHREQYEFITRQFKMLGDAMAARAAESAPRIELENILARTPTNLDLLAQRAGADWVANLVVEEATLDSSAGGGFTARTRVRLQIWDARRHGWLANNSCDGHADGGGVPVFVFKNSLDDATKVSLESLLRVYPQLVSVLQENSLKDYLAGQTSPFVGDPKTPFSGLDVGQ